MMNKEFDEWFWELEGYHIRSERFWDDVDHNRREQIYEWMQTAFEVGYAAGQKLYGGTE
jgi:hypothetical protein